MVEAPQYRGTRVSALVWQLGCRGPTASARTRPPVTACRGSSGAAESGARQGWTTLHCAPACLRNPPALAATVRAHQIFLLRTAGRDRACQIFLLRAARARSLALFLATPWPLALRSRPRPRASPPIPPSFPAGVLQDEPFYQISLDVRGKRTLAESLRSFVRWGAGRHAGVAAW